MAANCDGGRQRARAASPRVLWHCHGYGHQYQWTEAEYTDAVNKAIDAGKLYSDGMVASGYDMNADLHPECPESGGHGVEVVHMADTRRPRGSACRLYAGAADQAKA